MASTFYATIFEKAEARGNARRCADTIIRVLTLRAGALDPAIAMRIRAVSSIATLDAWWSEALDLTDAESARRLIETISAALPPL